MRPTRDGYESALRAVEGHLPVGQPMTLRQLDQLMEIMADEDPRALLRAWAGLQQFQREWRGDMSIFSNPTIMDTKTSIRKAYPGSNPSQAKAPSRDDMRAVLGVVMDPKEAPLMRVTAFYAILQYKALQRASSILAVDHDRLLRGPRGQAVILHTHKTQTLNKEQGVKELVPSEPFEGGDVFTALERLVADKVLPDRGEFVRKIWRVNTFNKNLKALWKRIGHHQQAAGEMLSHGLRRGGFQYYYEKQVSVSTILRMGHWTDLKSAKPYLPPAIRHWCN